MKYDFHEEMETGAEAAHRDECSVLWARHDGPCHVSPGDVGVAWRKQTRPLLSGHDCLSWKRQDSVVAGPRNKPQTGIPATGTLVPEALRNREPRHLLQQPLIQRW